MRKPRVRKPRAQYSAFVFTKHKFSSLKAELDKIVQKCVYIVVGLETCPTTGKLHLQGYFFLKNPISKGKARKFMNRVHLEPARECPAKNFLYCSKENQYQSAGSIVTALRNWLPPL